MKNKGEQILQSPFGNIYFRRDPTTGALRYMASTFPVNVLQALLPVSPLLFSFVDHPWFRSLLTQR